MLGYTDNYNDKAVKGPWVFGVWLAMILKIMLIYLKMLFIENMKQSLSALHHVEAMIKATEKALCLVLWAHLSLSVYQ